MWSHITVLYTGTSVKYKLTWSQSKVRLTESFRGNIKCSSLLPPENKKIKNINSGLKGTGEKRGNSQYLMVAMLTGATHVTTLSMTIRTEWKPMTMSRLCDVQWSKEDVKKICKLSLTMRARHVAVRSERSVRWRHDN